MVKIVDNYDPKMPPAQLIVDKLDLQTILMHQTDHNRAKVGEGEIRENFLVQTIGKLDTETFSRTFDDRQIRSTNNFHASNRL